MSTFIKPKMDWKAESIPKAEDFNRIEGNIDYLEKEKVDKAKLAANNGVATLDANGNLIQKAVKLNVLSFSGGTTGSYDGSTAKNILIPTALPTPNTLTVGTKQFNGSTPITIVKGDIGLGNVDNTSDVNKPISTAVQVALNTKINISELGKNQGVASLDANGNLIQKAVKLNVLSFSGGTTGSYDGSTAKNISIPTALPTPNTLTVGTKQFNGSTPITIVKGDVGLGNVDNTSDINKPISTAVQVALNGKLDTKSVVTGIKLVGDTAFKPGEIEITAAKVGAVALSGGGTVTSGSIIINNGSITAKSFIATSDLRLKKDISKVDNDLSDKLLKLNIVNYRFKDDDTNKQNIGVIAQDLEEIFGKDAPYLVVEREDGIKRIDPNGIFFLLVDLVKKQEKRITALETMINEAVKR